MNTEGYRCAIFIYHPELRTPIIYEMKAMDWSQSKKGLNHLRDLEITKPVGREEVDLLIDSDYYEELLLPVEHRVGKRGDPVGVKIQPGWTVVGQNINGRLIPTAEVMSLIEQTTKARITEMYLFCKKTNFCPIFRFAIQTFLGG